MIGLLLAATTASAMDKGDRQFTFVLAKAKVCADLGRKFDDQAMTWIALNVEHDMIKISTPEIMAAAENLAPQQKEFNFTYCKVFADKYASKS